MIRDFSSSSEAQSWLSEHAKGPVSASVHSHQYTGPVEYVPRTNELWSPAAPDHIREYPATKSHQYSALSFQELLAVHRQNQAAFGMSHGQESERIEMQLEPESMGYSR